MIGAALLGGCTFVSRDGPATTEVVVNAEVTLTDPGLRLSYVLVDLNPLTLDFFSSEPKRFARFKTSYQGTGPAEVRMGAGDTVNVSIFEVSGGGLFLPEGNRAGATTIPTQQVDASGTITVPYAGAIRVIGRTPKQVQAEIEEKLRARAIEPQVIVTVADKRSSEITVLGEVGSPTRFTPEPSGIKLLSALARAGGPKNPAYETIVTIQRGGGTEQALLSAVVTDPSQNIFIAPGDVIYASRSPRAFLALGATASTAVGVIGSNNRRFVFEQENLTLADGVAKAGGLIDERADASAVFLYRLVSRRTLAHAGIDVSRYTEPTIPTIFRADLSRAEGLFLANSFYMEDKDIIYVSAAPAQDLNKFVTVISNIASVASSVTTVRAVGSATTGVLR